MNRDKLEQRRQAFKGKGVTQEEHRRRREEASVEIRRVKRDETLNKRRGLLPNGVSVADSSASAIFSSYSDHDSDEEKTLFSATSSKTPKYEEPTANLYSDDPIRQHSGAVEFRRILSKERNPPIDDVISCNIVPRLVQLLTGPQGSYPNETSPEEAKSLFQSIQFESAWALTNIASGTSNQTWTCVQHNSIPVFIQLLQTTDSKDVLEQSVWALGNIAGDTTETRNMALNSGIMNPLLVVIQNALNSPSLLRNAVWTLSNLCRGKPAPPWGAVVDCIPILAGLLRTIHNDYEVIADILWSLSYLSDGPNNHIDVVLQSGVVPRIVELLASSDSPPSVQTPALRTLGNIVTGNDIQTQTVLQANILPALISLLHSNPKASLIKETCWTISNITAGNPDQIQAVIYSGLIPLVIDILANGEFKARKEACWAISNATSAKSTRPDQVRYLVSEGCIPPLCDILSCQDNKIIQIALDAVEAILEVGEREFLAAGGSVGECQPYALQVEEAGGLDRIYELQGHENVHIYEKARNILEKYFSEDDALLEGDEQEVTESTPAAGFHIQ